MSNTRENVPLYNCARLICRMWVKMRLFCEFYGVCSFLFGWQCSAGYGLMLSSRIFYAYMFDCKTVSVTSYVYFWQTVSSPAYQLLVGYCFYFQRFGLSQCCLSWSNMYSRISWDSVSPLSSVRLYVNLFSVRKDVNSVKYFELF